MILEGITLEHIYRVIVKNMLSTWPDTVACICCILDGGLDDGPVETRGANWVVI